MSKPYEDAGLDPSWAAASIVRDTAVSAQRWMGARPYATLGQALMLLASENPTSRTRGEHTKAIQEAATALTKWAQSSGFEEDIPVFLAAMGQVIALMDPAQDRKVPR